MSKALVFEIVGEKKGTPDNLANVGRDEVPDELLGVLVDRATFLDGGLDARKVVVGEDHVGGQLGDCVQKSSARDRESRQWTRTISSGSHGDSDGGATERGCVVDSISGLGDSISNDL